MSRTAQAVKEAATTLNQVPALTLVNNQPRASSIEVAAKFGKRHDHVLRQIRQIVANCPESFNAPNFGAVETKDDKGELRPAYTMTRDGFTILAMGFTGPKALAWKIRYIEAFNAMETELAAQARGGLALDGPSTVQARKPLSNLINTWVRHAPLDYRDAWLQINAHFQVEKAEDLTLAQVKEACVWVQERIDKLGAAHKNLDEAKAGRLLGLPDIISDEDYRKYEKAYAACVAAEQSLNEALQGMADITDKCRAVIQSHGEKNEPLRWLARAFDGEHCLDLILEVKRYITRCHAIIEFCRSLSRARILEGRKKAA